MPEGDTIHSAARRVGAALVGQPIVSIETPQERHALDRWPERLDGRAVRAVDARGEAAMTNNELALTYLGLGSLDEAARHVSTARSELEGVHDEFRLAHIADSEARIALARGDDEGAARLAAEAVAFAESSHNDKALVDALLTVARAARRQGDRLAAIAALERAAGVAADSPPARLRQVLTEWSEIAAEAGDHAAAYDLTRRALALR